MRSERYRYIRYADGTEELYDHAKDPNEWTNLAGAVKYKPVIQKLAPWIPKQFAPNAPSKNAYLFDPKAYSWTLKTKNHKK